MATSMAKYATYQIHSAARMGSLAAFGQVAVAITNLAIVVAFLGPKVAANPALVADLIRTQPLPFLWLEGLKILAAVCAALLVGTMRYVVQQPGATTWFGLSAVVLLALAGVIGALAIVAAHNPGFGFFSISLHYQDINQIVNGLGRAALGMQGIWLLLVSWHAWKQQALPKGLSMFGLLLGGINLAAYTVPPLALLALILGLIWSAWLALVLGQILRRQ